MEPNRIAAQPIVLPRSGRIIGALVEALGLDEEVLSNKTAKRFYDGQSVTEYSAKEIYLALGRVLVETGVIPTPPLFTAHDVSMPVIVAATLARMATKWDGLRAILESQSSPVVRTDTATLGFLKLVVVDLALRAFALLRLAQLPPPEDATPLWAEENGAGKALRKLLADAGLTRDQAAARLGVSYTSVDNWLDGKIRPSPEHIHTIADELAKLLKDVSGPNLQAYLQRQFTLSTIADSLAQQIGWDLVRDLARAFCRFTRLITEDVAQMVRPPQDEVAGGEMDAMRYGCDSPSSIALLRNLALVERDPEWKRNIYAACNDWSARFQLIANQSGFPRSAGGLAQDLIDLPPPAEASQGNGAAVYVDEADEDLSQLVDEVSKLTERVGSPSASLELLGQTLRSGLVDRRWIVSRHPLSPKAHFVLGSFLGLMGKWLGGPDMVNEGAAECRISAALRADWDAPRVEVGIILANVGRYQEALAALEEASEKLHGWTPHLAFALGYVRMQFGQTREALEAFEYVVDARPDYALALDHAAHCCFKLGDNAKGQRYANKARHLGVSSAFVEWQLRRTEKRQGGH